jgi:peroxiredoxin
MTEIGTKAPDARLESLDGGTVRISDLFGRPLLISFLRYVG